MDKEEIESFMQKILKKSQDFKDSPSYELATDIDKDISILRFIIGESNFLPLHYFRATHEEVVKYIDACRKSEEKCK